MPNRLAKQVAFLEQNDSVVAVGSNVLLIDDDGSPVGYGEPLLTHGEIEHKDLYHGGCGLIHPTMVVRHEAIRLAGGYRSDFRYALDLDLCLRLGEVGKLANLREALIQCRKSREGVSGSRYVEQQEFVRRAVKDAWRRRGLPLPYPEILEAKPQAQSAGQFHRDISLYAVNAGFYASGRKHAWRSLCLEPLALLSWKTAARAALGWALPPLRRLRGARSISGGTL